MPRMTNKERDARSRKLEQAIIRLFKRHGVKTLRVASSFSDEGPVYMEVFSFPEQPTLNHLSCDFNIHEFEKRKK